MAYNIMEDSGRAAIEDYIDSFSTDEQIEMRKMIELTRLKGQKWVKAKITEGLEFTDSVVPMAAVLRETPKENVRKDWYETISDL